MLQKAPKSSIKCLWTKIQSFSSFLVSNTTFVIFFVIKISSMVPKWWKSLSCRFVLKGIFSVVLFWEVLIQEIELWRILNYKWRILQKRSTVWTLISLEQWPISPSRHSSAPRYLHRTKASSTFVTLWLKMKRGYLIILLLIWFLA